MKQKQLLYLCLGTLVGIAIVVSVNYIYRQHKIKAINSYEECIQYFPEVTLIYPPQCHTSDGRTFTQAVNEEKTTPPALDTTQE